MLCVAIRDSRGCQAKTQWAVNHCWAHLFETITDEAHWNSLTLQKDGLYFRAIERASIRLHFKFADLFAVVPNCPSTDSVEFESLSTPPLLSDSLCSQTRLTPSVSLQQVNLER